eukprot:c4302_g1_i1.p1 GENE.c4302_g1_i1~~c4302_g1_i1.p1  ORF type:complete len:455 (-),score=115.30 c4302_g1_i1:26-1390(-)
MKRFMIFLSIIAAVSAANCIKLKPWYDYSKVNLEIKCPAFVGAANVPHFHNPVDCYTREVIQELALSISNEVFQCDKWCVYSLQSELAWIWVPASKCWKENKFCTEIPDEVALLVEQKEKLCPVEIRSEPTPPCNPLKNKRDLTIKSLKTKCPKYHSQAKPILHHPVVCETGEMDGELSQAIVNGAFSECQNWCIYSLKNPAKVSWFWDAKRDCWTTNNECSKINKEVQYALELRSKLCTAPCTEARVPQLLSPTLLTLKCPNYTVNHIPQFHHATVCNATEENYELKLALANFAFQECRNWCVYSLEAPGDTSWEWVPKGKCWKPSVNCLSLKPEIEFVQGLREVLCLEPSEKDLAYRRKQRPTVLPEDTGLWGDTGTQEDAIEMYRYFAGMVCLSLVVLILLHCMVPPAQHHVTTKFHSHSKAAGVADDDDSQQQYGDDGDDAGDVDPKKKD